VFYEPQTSSDVETVLREYGVAISSVCPMTDPDMDLAENQSQAASQNGGKSRKNGALLFAVVGGKLSEGKRTLRPPRADRFQESTSPIASVGVSSWSDYHSPMSVRSNCKRG